MSNKQYDVIIVGAGPAGLATAARLRESTPSAIFTDDEHQRYHWLQKHKGKMAIKNIRGSKNVKQRADSFAEAEPMSMLVLDNSGTSWMSNWNRLFRTFEISHLRSPMFFHVDPKDRDALLAYAEENGSPDDLVEITNCVGKERSKHKLKKDRKFVNRSRGAAIDERERKDYFVPSTRLFDEHCRETVEGYGLAAGDVLRNELVENIDFGVARDHDATYDQPVFTIRTNKKTYRSRICVLAVGCGLTPRMPAPFDDDKVEGCCHAMRIKSFPDPALQKKIDLQKPTTALVIGAGLTAAHLAINALKHGVSKVVMITRSQLKIKPFDVDLDWIGKYRNTNQAVFWSADTDEERLKQLRDARNGGSITPRINKMMQPYLTQGRLSIHTNTIITDKKWNSEHRTWSVKTQPAIPGLPEFDYVYCATGLENDIQAIPCLRTMHDKYPTKVLGGLPCLTEGELPSRSRSVVNMTKALSDLSWAPNVPLFVTGRLAGLRLGPGAANLSGARTGAERVAWAIQSVLDRGSGSLDDADSSHDAATDYVAGVGSRYDCLYEE